MKKITALLTSLALVLGLCACTAAQPTWQEQYDLGVRYLSEGSYREAIIAFTAAIEIDPRQADAYLGLADAYVAMGDTELAIQILKDALENVEDSDAVMAIKVRLTELAPELELLGHTWKDADCTTPRTCSICGETEGEPISHTWEDAACTTPRTCSICGETEGEPLGHTWEDAACTTPRTCSICGEIEGEPLGHTLAEANYQEPATCTVCGETEGDVLTPDFVTYGIVADMEVGVHYAYETVTSEDKNIKVIGDIVVLDYSVFESDGTHEAKEGYEWRVATFEFTFTDDNAWEYGYKTYAYVDKDYYNTRLHEDSWINDDGRVAFTANYHGEDMECYRYIETLTSGWQEDYLAKYTYTVNYLVPAGYDGCVHGVVDIGLGGIYAFDDGHFFDVYSPDSFHLFRFA